MITPVIDPPLIPAIAFHIQQEPKNNVHVLVNARSRNHLGGHPTLKDVSESVIYGVLKIGAERAL
ncbi:MAG: hypothetical protein O6918_09465, partial [Deltaproteobacteria bacterium]|nr:hypothetical protein [Deltaproteobacteria bacterium]